MPGDAAQVGCPGMETGMTMDFGESQSRAHTPASWTRKLPSWGTAPAGRAPGSEQRPNDGRMQVPFLHPPKRPPSNRPRCNPLAGVCAASILPSPTDSRPLTTVQCSTLCGRPGWLPVARFNHSSGSILPLVPHAYLDPPLSACLGLLQRPRHSHCLPRTDSLPSVHGSLPIGSWPPSTRRPSLQVSRAHHRERSHRPPAHPPLATAMARCPLRASEQLRPSLDLA